MLGALLILLVILNAFATGWLISQTKSMKKVVTGLANSIRDIGCMQHEMPTFGDEV